MKNCKQGPNSHIFQFHSKDFEQDKFQTPTKLKNTDIIELKIDLTHPSKEIIAQESHEKVLSGLDFLKNGDNSPKMQGNSSIEKIFNHSVSPPKLHFITNGNRKFKNNTIDNPRLTKLSCKASPKMIHTEPSCFYKNEPELKNKGLTNPIYSLDYEIQAHSKANLEQNISTGFTPNSKHTVEEIESDDIWEEAQDLQTKNAKKFNKIINLETIQHFEDFSKNLKYVEGGVGIVDFKEISDKTQKQGSIGLDEKALVNVTVAPFNPVLLMEKQKQQSTEKKSKILAFIQCLTEKCS